MRNAEEAATVGHWRAPFAILPQAVDGVANGPGLFRTRPQLAARCRGSDRQPEIFMTRSVRQAVRHLVLLAALALPPLAALAHGPGHPGGPPPLAAALLDDVLHASLGLTRAQETLWVTLDAHDAGLHALLESSREAIESLVASELAKTAPDLALIDTARAATRDAIDAAVTQVDGDALALYASLTAEQRAAVVNFVKAIVAQHAAEGRPAGPPPGR